MKALATLPFDVKVMQSDPQLIPSERVYFDASCVHFGDSANYLGAIIAHPHIKFSRFLPIFDFKHTRWDYEVMFPSSLSKMTSDYLKNFLRIDPAVTPDVATSLHATPALLDWIEKFLPDEIKKRTHTRRIFICPNLKGTNPLYSWNDMQWAEYLTSFIAQRKDSWEVVILPSFRENIAQSIMLKLQNENISVCNLDQYFIKNEPIVKNAQRFFGGKIRPLCNIHQFVALIEYLSARVAGTQNDVYISNDTAPVHLIAGAVKKKGLKNVPLVASVNLAIRNSFSFTPHNKSIAFSVTEDYKITPPTVVSQFLATYVV